MLLIEFNESKSILWIVLSKTINILRNLRGKKKKQNIGCPQECCHMFMYKDPSSDGSLVTLNLPFKVILRRFDVVFWCLWECENAALFKPNDENSLKFTNTILRFALFSSNQRIRWGIVKIWWLNRTSTRARTRCGQDALIQFCKSAFIPQPVRNLSLSLRIAS